MSVGQCCPVEEWGSMFAYFAGTNSAKYNDKQIETMLRQSAERGWCVVGDRPIEGSRERHIRAHLRELTTWRSRRTGVTAKPVAALLEPTDDDE